MVQRNSFSNDEFDLSQPAELEECRAKMSASFSEAERYYGNKQYEVALQHYTKALSFAGPSRATFVDYFNCYSKIGSCYKALAKNNPLHLNDAKENLLKAATYLTTRSNDTIRDQAIENQEAQLTLTHNLLSEIYYEQKKYDKAIWHAKKAVKYAKVAYKNDQVKIAICLEKLSQCYLPLAQYGDAIKYLEEARNIYAATTSHALVKDLRDLSRANRDLGELRQLMSKTKPAAAPSSFGESKGTSDNYNYDYGNCNFSRKFIQPPSTNLTILSLFGTYTPVTQQDELSSSSTEPSESPTSKKGKSHDDTLESVTEPSEGPISKEGKNHDGTSASTTDVTDSESKQPDNRQNDTLESVSVLVSPKMSQQSDSSSAERESINLQRTSSTWFCCFRRNRKVNPTAAAVKPTIPGQSM